MKVLANSVQKSGTHLLLRLLGELGVPRFLRWRIDPEWTLERSRWKRMSVQMPFGERVPVGMGVEISARWVRRLLGRMPDESALLAHCAHSPQMSAILKSERARMICIVRDPRDVAVSHAHFLMKIGKDKITRRPEHRALVALPDHAARITALLRGHGATRSVAQRFRELLPWRSEPGCLFVRFEDLIGARGGGDESRQLAAVRNVAAHVGHAELGDAAARRIAGGLFGGTATFRKGLIGQWREEFTDEHGALARDTLADVLSAFGYD